jgi:hypothetical protein
VATKPQTIDEYLADLSPENCAALQKVRRAVHAAAPGADECSSYRTPAFRLDGKLIAGFKAAANPRALPRDEIADRTGTDGGLAMVQAWEDKPRTRVLTLDEETLLLEPLHPRFLRVVRFAPGTGCRWMRSAASTHSHLGRSRRSADTGSVRTTRSSS